MSSNNKTISQIENFSLSKLSIDQLKSIKKNLINKKNKVEDRLNQLNDRLEAIKKADNFDSFIPKTFTSSLRQTLIKNNQLKKIKDKLDVYNSEIKSIENFIEKKYLNKKQTEIFWNNNYITKAKESIETILIIFVLSLMTYEFYLDQNISTDLALKIFWMDAICCILFLSNFFFELRLAKSKSWYIKNHWIDFITSIPLPNAKILRFGRVLRLVRILRLLRTLKFLRIILLFFRGMESFKELFDIKIMRKTLTYSFILIFIGSVSIIYFENQSGGVDNFINGLWWSFTTLVTGGFGDIHNPKTTGGMFVTVILIIAGMVLIGVFIAGLSNVIESNSENDDDDYIEYFEKKFEDLNNKIDENKTDL